MNKNSQIIESAENRSSRSGTTFGYTVEARFNYRNAKTVAGHIFDNRWREVPFGFNDIGRGNPRPKFVHSELSMANLLSKNEANALRWNFICHADADDICGSLCLETRIVEHEITYSFSAKPVKYLDAFDMRGDLPEDMAHDESN